MRAVVQRVSSANVKVDDQIKGEIKKGYVVLLGVGLDDNKDDISYLAEKILNLRVFTDSEGKMNLPIKDICGELLIVSQFTLYGDARKGNRPSFSKASSPEIANELYIEFVDYMKQSELKVETGVFQAHMDLEIHNDGPVTILYDSKKIF